MKRLALITLLAIFSSACNMFDDNITVINPANRNSPNAVFAQAVNDAVNGSYYQAQDCEDAARKYDNTKNAVFIYDSSLEFAARNKGLDCLLENVKDKTVVFTGTHYFKLCRRPGTDFTLEPGKQSKPVTVGIASMLATQGHEKTFKDKGVDAKIVAYSGSKTVARALIAGDIDIGFMGQGVAAKQGDAIECMYSTDPALDNYLAKTVDVAVPDFHIALVVYTNSKDPAVIEKLRAVGQNEGFQSYLTTSKTTGSFDATNEDADAAIKFVQRMYKHWVDNDK